MEVSSHGLSQNRVDGIVFDVAAFTNLSRDHLDHHGTMDAYFATKARLFEEGRCRTAVIAVDDPWGRRMADRASAERVVTVRRSDATDIALSIGRSSFRWRGRTITLPLSGMFNVDNALVAATVGESLGVDPDLVAQGLAAAAPVPGRMEVVWRRASLRRAGRLRPHARRTGGGSGRGAPSGRLRPGDQRVRCRGGS